MLPIGLIAVGLFLVGWQAVDPSPYRDFVNLIIYLIVGFAGAPISQLFKSLLTFIFKKPVEDKWAVLATGAISLLIALGEMWYTGQLANLTFETLLSNALVIYGLASLYFGLLKNNEGFFGTKFLLKGYKPS